jgi:hypothetical protein
MLCDGCIYFFAESGIQRIWELKKNTQRERERERERERSGKKKIKKKG